MAKILLVEDDKSLREIYGVRLMAEGYEIVSAGDGEEALAMAIKERPDLIVSDVMMPKISGFDMLDILRSTSETKDVKVIMMTALSSDDQRARGEALGADRYLVKSQVGIEDVVRTVHDVLGDSIATPAALTFPPSTSAPAPAPAAAPAAPISTPAPLAPVEVPAPVTPVEPAQPFIQPVQAQPIAQPQPVAQPEPLPTPVAAPVMPVAPVPAPAPAPAPVAAPVSVPAPSPYASTTINELPANPVAPAPTQAPYAAAPPSMQMPAATPVAAPTSLPQPTAPFSSPAPASLGERVIEPLSNLAAAPGANDIASQIEQALNGQLPPQTPPTVPPAA